MELELPPGASVGDAIRQLQARCPVLRDLVGNTAAAVNLEYAAFAQPLKEGDELALIPPVSGGGWSS